MLSLPIPNRRRIPLGIATAVAVALVAAAPSHAAPTAVEQTSATSFNYALPGSATSFNYALPGSATSFNYALPGDAIGLNFTRKAG